MITIVPYPYDGENGKFKVSYSDGIPYACKNCLYKDKCVIIGTNTEQQNSDIYMYMYDCIMYGRVIAYAEKETEPEDEISQISQISNTTKICPKCGGIMFMKDDIVYTSYPPKYKYICKKCSYYKIE